MYFYYDPTYVLILIGAVLSGIASLGMNRRFRQYSRIFSSRGLTAETAASVLLRATGNGDVAIGRISGSLTDHYSPADRTLRLSDSVYGSASVAAIAVAAHECGHAMQHRERYLPLQLRTLSVPLANVGAKCSWIVLLAGSLLGLPAVARAGAWLFALVVFFQLITLPVEFNASRRAMGVLEQSGLLFGDELTGAKRVLKAAALTYVAALASSLLQLLRLLMITRSRNRRR